MIRVAAAGMSLVLVGCIGGRAGTFGAISSRQTGADVEILASAVEGRSCPGGMGAYGDYSTAVEDALRRVPGADVLVNARFYSQEYLWGRICVRVEGDAGRLKP